MSDLTIASVTEAMEGTKGVTPGPWTTDDPGMIMTTIEDDIIYLAQTDGPASDTGRKQSVIDAAHIARCSPEFIQELCADWLRQRTALERIAHGPVGESFSSLHCAKIAMSAISAIPSEDKHHEP